MFLRGMMFCLWFGIFGAIGWGQQNPKPDLPSEDEIADPFPEPIVVKVELQSRTGGLPKHLSYQDFRIFDDGKEQPLEAFRIVPGPKSTTGKLQVELMYTPNEERFDGAYRQIKVRIRPKLGKSLYVSYWPKGYFSRKFS